MARNHTLRPANKVFFFASRPGRPRRHLTSLIAHSPAKKNNNNNNTNKLTACFSGVSGPPTKTVYNNGHVDCTCHPFDLIQTQKPVPITRAFSLFSLLFCSITAAVNNTAPLSITNDRKNNERAAFGARRYADCGLIHLLRPSLID